MGKEETFFGIFRLILTDVVSFIESLFNLQNE